MATGVWLSEVGRSGRADAPTQCRRGTSVAPSGAFAALTPRYVSRDRAFVTLRETRNRCTGRFRGVARELVSAHIGSQSGCLRPDTTAKPPSAVRLRPPPPTLPAAHGAFQMPPPAPARTVADILPPRQGSIGRGRTRTGRREAAGRWAWGWRSLAPVRLAHGAGEGGLSDLGGCAACIAGMGCE